MRLYRLLLGLCLLVVLLGIDCAGPPPYEPLAAPETQRIVTYEGVVHLGGSGFGDDPDPERSFLEIRCADRQGIVRADDERVFVWRDDLVEVRGLPRGWPSRGCQVTVHVDGSPVPGAENVVVDEVRRHRSYPADIVVPATLRPLAVAYDETSETVVLDAEFHESLYLLSDLEAPRAQSIAIPQDDTLAGVFQGPLDAPTRRSALAEKVLVQPGRSVAWFSQGGRHLYAGNALNASRINRYSAETGRFRCWNVPYNNAQVMGLYWQNETGHLWAALSNYGEAGAIVSFRPSTFGLEQTPCDHDFADYEDESSYPAQTCGPGDEDGCFHLHPIPPNLGGVASLRPAHLLMDPRGDVWGSAFFGGGLVRFSPGTGLFRFYPFPPARSESDAGQTVGSGPWEIVLDASGTALYVTEFFDAQIIRFDIDRADREDCTTLDASGESPCITEYSAPVDTQREHVHSLVRDGPELYYFTVSTGDDPVGDARLGRLETSSERQEVLLFPPLATVLGTAVDGAAGIALDPVRGALFVANPNKQSIDVFQDVSDPPSCGLGAELLLLVPIWWVRRLRA